MWRWIDRETSGNVDALEGKGEVEEGGKGRKRDEEGDVTGRCSRRGKRGYNIRYKETEA